MLDFRTETFLCVCKHMNFTKAGHELNLTQPAVSQHIKYLEEYYGTKLFEYKKKTLSLTKAGVMLKNSMISMRHDALFLKDRVKNGNNINQIKFGATLSIGEFLLPPKLTEFFDKNKDMSCNLTIADTKALIERLDEGTIDFALVEGYFNKAEYDYRLIKTEKFVAVCGSGYDLPKIEKFEDLFKHHLLIREQGSGTREILTNYLNEHGYSVEHFNGCTVINSLNVIKYLLENNRGISFLYNVVVEDSIKDGRLKKIEIPNFELSHEFNFIWRKNSIFADDYYNIFDELFL